MSMLRPKHRISHEEVVADVIFFITGAAISFLALLIFDVHWNLYQWPSGPLRFIFQSQTPYLIGVPIGSIVFFILVKLLVLGFHEEEIALRKRRR